jgi:hypothetical protein
MRTTRPSGAKEFSCRITILPGSPGTHEVRMTSREPVLSLLQAPKPRVRMMDRNAMVSFISGEDAFIPNYPPENKPFVQLTRKSRFRAAGTPGTRDAATTGPAASVSSSKQRGASCSRVVVLANRLYPRKTETRSSPIPSPPEHSMPTRCLAFIARITSSAKAMAARANAGSFPGSIVSQMALGRA